MRGAEGVVLTFVASGKPAEPAELAQAAHALAPACQDLVRVGLMAHVPDQTVIRRAEHVVQGHRELHRAQVGTQVPTGLRDAVQQVGTQLVSQRLELGAGQQAQVCGAVDGFEQRVHLGVL